MLAPHPDDEVFGCGGAIMRHRNVGDPVHVIIATDGGQLRDPRADRAAYIAQRQQESIAAAQILGYGLPVFWDFHDRELQYGEELVDRLLAAIEQYEARWLYAPSILEIHPDHRRLGMAAIEAARRTTSGLTLAMYEVGRPLPPNRLLDLTDILERKRRAMRCFASQLQQQAYDEHIEALNRFRTYTLPREVKAAEAYWVIDGVDDSFSEICALEVQRHQSLSLSAFGMNAAAHLLKQQKALTAERAELQQRLDTIIQSRSWRLTMPLRRLSTWWRGFVR